MHNWRAQLRIDPVPALLAGGDDALRYHVRRDLLGEPVEPASLLWQLAAARRILRKQRADGSWPHPGERKGTAVNYYLVETWRQFRFLVELDAYTSYQAASYWLRFEYPCWWNNLVAALDSVSLIGLSCEEAAIRQALAWLRDNQEESGLWRATYAKAEDRRARARTVALWVSLAVCRVLQRFYG